MYKFTNVYRVPSCIHASSYDHSFQPCIERAQETIEPITGFSKKVFNNLQDGQSDFMRNQWMAIKASSKLVNQKIKEITG